MAQFNYATGKIRWAKVLDLVPNYNRDGFEWTFDFYPDDDGLKLFRDLGIVKKMKDDKEGTKFLRFTQKEKQANGKANFPITVVTARNTAWDPQRNERGEATNKIGNDSLVEVKFKVVDYGKGMPTGVYPQALRVLEPKAYVRQEFAPLPEDSQYVQNFAEPVAVDDVDAPVEGDVLDAE